MLEEALDELTGPGHVGLVEIELVGTSSKCSNVCSLGEHVETCRELIATPTVRC